MLAKGTVTSPVAPSEPVRLSSVALAAYRWRKFGTDKDISQVFGAGKREHGGQGHVFTSIIITITV